MEMWHVLGVWQEHTCVIGKALDPVQVSCFYRVGRAGIAPDPANNPRQKWGPADSATLLPCTRSAFYTRKGVYFLQENRINM